MNDQKMIISTKFSEFSKNFSNFKVNQHRPTCEGNSESDFKNYQHQSENKNQLLLPSKSIQNSIEIEDSTEDRRHKKISKNPPPMDCVKFLSEPIDSNKRNYIKKTENIVEGPYLRPVVDQFSITYSTEGQWMKRNFEIFNKTSFSKNLNDKSEQNVINLMEINRLDAEKQRNHSKLALHERKSELEECEDILRKEIFEMIDEISILDEHKVRLKKSLVVLKLPESIASECLRIRGGRPESELIMDEVQNQLIDELSRIAEIRYKLNETLNKIEMQLTENKSAQRKLEYDWSNKKDAIDIERRNVQIDANSTIVMNYPNAKILSPWQASLQYWKYFTSEILKSCQSTRKKSIELRSNLSEILKNYIEELRLSADRVEEALQRKISYMENIIKCLENELISSLKNLVKTENRIENIQRSIANLKKLIKLSQTCLNYRTSRKEVENTYDIAQQTLINEEQKLHLNLEQMESELIYAKNCKNQLIYIRGTLEREINVKRSTLLLDRDRLMLLRSRFPTKNELLATAIV